MTSLSAFIAPDRLVADRLRHAPAFATLPADRVECLATLRLGVMYDIPADTVVTSPGDPPALIVVIEGGLFDTEHLLSWPAGSCLGTRELTADMSFASSLVTVSPTSLYRLDAEWYEPFLQRCPAIARCILATVGADAPGVAWNDRSADSLRFGRTLQSSA